jgi:hypothetical protein
VETWGTPTVLAWLRPLFWEGRCFGSGYWSSSVVVDDQEVAYQGMVLDSFLLCTKFRKTWLPIEFVGDEASKANLNRFSRFGSGVTVFNVSLDLLRMPN